MNFSPILTFLKPCPFCQHQAPIVNGEYKKLIKTKLSGFGFKYTLICPCCDAQGPLSASKIGAFAFWQNPTMPKLDVKNEDGTFMNDVYAQAQEYATRTALTHPDGTTEYYINGLLGLKESSFDWNKIKSGDIVHIFPESISVK